MGITPYALQVQPLDVGRAIDMYRRGEQDKVAEDARTEDQTRQDVVQQNLPAALAGGPDGQKAATTIAASGGTNVALGMQALNYARTLDEQGRNDSVQNSQTMKRVFQGVDPTKITQDQFVALQRTLADASTPSAREHIMNLQLADLPHVLQVASVMPGVIEADRAAQEFTDKHLSSVAGRDRDAAAAAKDRAAATASSAVGAQAADPDTIDYLATRYRHEGALPPLGMGREASGLRRAIIARAAQMAKAEGSGAADDIGTASGVRADRASLAKLQTQTDAIVAYEQNAQRNIKIVRGIALDKSGKPTGAVGTYWPIINRWVQSGRVATGDTQVPPYVASLVTVMNEYAKIMSGATGSQGSTDGARQEAASLLNANMTWDQVSNVLDTVIVPDMENRRITLNDQLKTIKGRITGKPGDATEPPPATTTTTAPADGAPQEGAQTTSRSGKPMIFSNGHWQYK